MGVFAVLSLLVQGFASQQPAAPPPPPPPPVPVFGTAPACAAYWTATDIFSGELLDIESSPNVRADYPRVRTARFRVDRRWRGNVAGEAVLRVFADPSQIDFKEGEKYLVYTRRMPVNGALIADSRTRLLSEAAEDLAYFERAERPSSGATISGTAAFDNGDDDSPRPAAGYIVRLGNAEREWTTATNAKGIFTFTSIPADRYGIRLEVPEGVRVKGPTTVDIPDARACAEPNFRIVDVATVGLFVLDANGKPAVRTTLELIDVDTLQERTPKVVGARTYADGSVAWAEVRAGHRYIIGLNVTRVPDPKRPQPILFYPGVSDIREAHTFEVGPGENVQLDTFRLPEPPARLTITGVVARPDGTPIRAADVILRSAAKLSRGQPVGLRARTNADGGFTLPAVAGYRYYVEVLLSVEGENPRLYAASEEFVLTDKTPSLRLVRR